MFVKFYSKFSILIILHLLKCVVQTKAAEEEAADDNDNYKEDDDDHNANLLPMVYNLQEECDSQQFNEDYNNNLQSCSEKAWHIVKNIQLTKPIDVRYNMNLSQCKKWCLNTINCVAIGSRNKNWQQCSIYKRNYASFIKKKFIAYFLKCCLLKNMTIVQQDFNHLPIIFHSEENCLPQSDGGGDDDDDNNNHDLRTCKNRAFLLHERKISQFNQFFVVKNMFECMDICLQDEKCKAYITIAFHDYEYDIECRLSHNNDDELVDYRWANVYQMICCTLNKQNDELSSQSNKLLLMLYHPHKVCRVISSNLANCLSPIWHVQDELRMKGHFNVTYNDYLNQCQYNCLQFGDCVGLSVDVTNSKCLYFKSGEYEKYYGQKHWISYTLQCCEKYIEEEK